MVKLLHSFLLTRHWKDSVNGIELCFWFCTPNGAAKVVIDGQQSVFFIEKPHVEKVQNLLQMMTGWYSIPLKLKSFSGDGIVGFYFNQQRLVYQAKKLLAEHQIPALESDIRPTDRYLMERFLTGSVSLQFSHHKTMSRYTEIHHPQMKSIDYQPEFKVVSLDIETSYNGKQLYSIALLSQQCRKVLMIGEGQNTSLIDYVKNEAQLLYQLIESIKKIDPDIIIGWNIVNFDFRVLLEKSQQLNIPLKIGRDGQALYCRQSTQRQNHIFIEIQGRVVLDGIEVLKSATYHYDSYALNQVAGKLLGRGKLIQENSTDSWSRVKEIQRQFEEDKVSLAEYNIEDCQLVWDIFEKADLMAFLIERTKLTGLELERFGGSVAAFDNLYLPRLHRKGYVAPTIEQQITYQSAPGGYVMNSQPGFYNHVLVLDYKSLYPSIIRTFKVDPYARIAAINLPDEATIPGFHQVRFAKQDNILPAIIEKLWCARDQAKKQNNQPLSQAIKIIMNSFYGVLGTKGCRIHDSRLTASITLRGHEIMKTTQKLIEEKGYDVIYGDTDSVFVWLKDVTEKHQIDQIGHGLSLAINQYWQDVLAEQYHSDCYLEMEYETHFTRFLMPTVRGSDKGSKKRYAGIIIQGDEEKLVFKGLETVRSDWTVLAKELQQNLYHRIFHDQPYEDYIREITEDVLNGRLNQQLIYRKRLRRKLADYQKNIPPHVQAALKAEQFFSANNQRSKYRNGGTISYIKTINGPEPMENIQSDIDFQHYIDKQIEPIVDNIVSFLGSSYQRITQRQEELGLFD
ncbi:MAG: DNA polymerase II [Methylococcales bacterium]|jgi:DNA polymerase II|nr:DNA polymerase II [Methylococcales bacterium]